MTVVAASIIGVQAPAQASATVLLAGSSWLNGQGVNVCAPSTDPSCGDQAHVGGWSGNWWQCVELAQRLYQARGWHGGIFANVSYAYQIYDQASALGMSRQANGSITSLVPGDMIIHDTDTPYSYGAGHVSIVDSVVGSTVNVVEQNTYNNDPTGQYTFSAGTLSRAGTGTIRGVVHDPGNQNPTPPSPEGLDDIFQATGASGTDRGWRVSIDGMGAWVSLRDSATSMSSLALGDFDGDDHLDDVFQASGVEGVGWRVSLNGTSPWQPLKMSTATMDTLALGDFDGDGHIDDVFQATGVSGTDRGWRVSFNGSTAWQPLKDSAASMNTLAIGDFDSDGFTDDIFQASGVEGVGWRVSMNGTGSWQSLRQSTTTMNTLMLGDFDGGGYLNDIFQATGATWRASMNGVDSWQPLLSSETSSTSLAIGDFDSDGHLDDVFQASGVEGIGWRVSLNGTNAWQSLRQSVATMDTLAIGDFS